MPLIIHPDLPPLAADATGTIRVAGTRVALETLIEQYRAGASAEVLAERFPAIGVADMHAVLAYYLRHRDEVDRYMDEQAREAEAALKGLGAHHQPWSGVEGRLRQRQGSGEAGGASLPRG